MWTRPQLGRYHTRVFRKAAEHRRTPQRGRMFQALYSRLRLGVRRCSAAVWRRLQPRAEGRRGRRFGDVSIHDITSSSVDKATSDVAEDERVVILAGLVGHNPRIAATHRIELVLSCI